MKNARFAFVAVCLLLSSCTYTTTPEELSQMYVDREQFYMGQSFGVGLLYRGTDGRYQYFRMHYCGNVTDYRVLNSEIDVRNQFHYLQRKSKTWSCELVRDPKRTPNYFCVNLQEIDWRKKVEELPWELPDEPQALQSMELDPRNDLGGIDILNSEDDLGDMKLINPGINLGDKGTRLPDGGKRRKDTK